VVGRAKLRLGAAAMMHMAPLYRRASGVDGGRGWEEREAQPAELNGHKLLLVGYGSGDAAETVVAKVMPTGASRSQDRLAKAQGNAVASARRLRPACIARSGRRKRRSRSAPLHHRARRQIPRAKFYDLGLVIFLRYRA